MSSHLITEIKACRVCGNSKLRDVLSLGNLYVTNFVDHDGAEQIRAPLDMVLCLKSDGGCGLLQLRHTFSLDKLYETYWYRSGINRTMTEELQGIARKAAEVADLQKGDYVIDTGSNDSTLLRGYPAGVRTVGFEPAKNLMEYAEPGVTKVVNDFFNGEAWAKAFPGEKAKVITSIAMFYDLEDPNKFVADVVKCLDPEGVWIVQQNYLPYMLGRNVFDNISHEHLEYYSLTSFKELLDRHGLEIADVELNDVNGGSMRTYIRHQGKGAGLRLAPGAAERVAGLLAKEAEMKLDEFGPYEAFALRVKKLRDDIFDFVRKEADAKKKIHVYGASTRGNTLLQFCNLDSSTIDVAADRNPMKWGKKTVGTLIPIVSEEESRSQNPHYYLILPWQFLPEFIEREREYLKNGGKFIVPLPEFRIVDGES